MKTVNMHEAKTHLSRLVQAAAGSAAAATSIISWRWIICPTAGAR